MSEVEAVHKGNGDSHHALNDKMEDGEESSNFAQLVYSADMDTLPPGYFTSPFFLGTMVASGFAIGGVR